MLDDIILGMISSAAVDVLVRHSDNPSSVREDDYHKAIRFLQHYSARKAYLHVEINAWGPEGVC